MHPVLVEFDNGFFLGTYGLMIAIGLMVAITVASKRGKKRGLQPDVFFDLAFVGVLSGFLAARLFYIFQNFGEFTADPMGLLLSRSGFVFLGGFIGAVAACLVYVKRKKLPVLKVGDVAAPSIAIAHGFGRIGCHFAGCCWGAACKIPGIGIRVPHQQLANGEVLPNASSAYPGGFINGVLHSQPVWPVQLMESAGLFILAGLLIYFATKPRRDGEVLAWYLIGYAVLRFFLEFVRGDEGRGLYFGGVISTSQLISLAMIPIGIWLLWWAKRGQKGNASL